MKKSKLAVQKSQLKWGATLSGYWQMGMLGTVMGSYLICLYLLCFDNRLWENIVPILVFNIFDVIYLVGTILRAFSEFQERGRGTVEFHYYDWYNLGSLSIDVLSLIPAEVFIFILTDGKFPQDVTNPPEQMRRVLFVLACLRTNRILRVYRILAYFRYETLKMRLNLYEREIRAIVVSFLVFVIIFFHGIASAWFALSCYPVYNEEPPQCMNSFQVRNDSGQNPFYQHINASLPDPWGRYVVALHWSVMTIRNSGNYYAVPVTAVEFASAMCSMLLGFFLTSAIICTAIYVMGQMDLCRSIYRHEVLGVTNFVTHLKMEEHVLRFLHEGFNHMWLRGRAFTDDVMKILIPKTLRTEISMSIFQPMVEASELLQTLRREAIEALSLEVEFKHYFPNEFVIRPQTVGYAMYYLLEGNVEIISNEDFKPILSIAKGSLIGECNLILPTYREHGVKTSTACEILKLQWSDVMSVIVLDPEARDRMHDIIKSRMNWNVVRKCKEVIKKQKSKAFFQTPRTHFLAGLLNRASIGSTGSGLSIDSPVSSGGSIDSEGYRTKAPLMIRQNLAIPGLENTQFMSLFTWLHFHKKEQYNRTMNKGFKSMLAKMSKRLRNEASIRCYTFLPIVTIPLYHWQFCAISRETNTFKLWDLIVNLTIIFYTIAYPFQLVLIEEFISQPIFVFVDMVYFVDLILRVFVFRDRTDMAPLVSMTQHFFNEARTRNIWFDIIPAFPLHNIAFIVRSQYDRTYLYLRMHMLCKFGKLVMRFRKWEHDVTLNTTILRILKHGIFTMIIIVFVACNFVQRRCAESYVDCVFEDNSTSGLDRARFNFEGGSILEILLYWAVCVTFGIGFTDVIAKSTEETTVHTIALFIGFLFMVYCISDFAATLASALENKINHQDDRIWLHRYLDDTLTPFELIARTDRYLDVQWLVLRGINADTANRSLGFLTVSHSMYSELMVHIMAECLYQVDLFKLLDADLVRQFCLTAKLAVLPPNEVIISKGDFVSRMYVIRRGTAEVILAKTGITLGTLNKGQSMGFGEVLYGTRSRVTITSITYLEVIIIDSSAFDRILEGSKAFVEMWNGLRSNTDAMNNYLDHFDEDKYRYTNTRADYKNVSKEVFVYHRVLRRLKVHKDQFIEEWKRLGIFRWLRVCMCPCTFLPTSNILRIWEAFRVMTIILMVLWLPVLEAFPLMKKNYGPLVYVTDVVTVIDMFFRLYVAYYDYKTNDLVTHPLHTARHYLSTAFLTDVIGGPAVYFLIDNVFKLYTSYEWDTSIYAFLLRMNRLILLYHIYGAYSFTERDSAFSSGQNSRRMAKLLPLFFFHAHMMACVLAVISCPARADQYPNPRCKANTWISMSKTLADRRSETANRSAVDITDIQIYVFSYYYVATTLVGCGFSDFLPANYLERRYTAVLFFIYIFALSYITASVVASKCHLDYKLLRYQQDMRYLLGFLRREKVAAYWTGKMIRYYDYQWFRTSGIEPHKLFSNLFPSLRKEVALCVFNDVIQQIPGLENLSVSFIRAICVHLSPIYFLKHNVVARQGDVCERIYIIYRGTVLNIRDKLERETTQEGGFIGNLDPNSIHGVYTTTATAVNNLDVFAIRKSDFIRVVAAFPAIAEIFGKLSKKYESQSAALSHEIERRKIKSQMVRLESSKQLEIHKKDPSGADSIERVNEVAKPEDVPKQGPSTRKLQSRTSNKVTTKQSKNNRRKECEDLSDCLQDLEGIVIGSDQLIEDPDIKPARENRRFYSQFILPESRPVLYFDIAVFIAASVSLSLVSYQAAFQDMALALYIIGYACDAVYWVKMVITFHFSYRNRFGDIITDNTDIENKYISNVHGFLWDFTSTFPLEMFAPIAPNGFTAMEFLNFLRLNRVIRLAQTWSYFKIKRSTSGVLINLLRMKLVRLLSFTAIYLHLAACILRTYTVYVNCGNCSSEVTNSTWLHTKRVDTGDPAGHPYVFTLYFILSTFTTTAYGDVTPVTKFEMLFISVIAVSSKVWLALALSDILSGFQNPSDITYHLAAQGVLKLYSDYGVSRELQEKTNKYLDYAWVENKGVIIPHYLSKAPLCMKMDMFYMVYGDHFRKSYLFRELGESFIRQACIRIKHVYVLAGDYIIQEKEIDNAIYFVHRGFVIFGRTIMDREGNTKEEEGILSRYRYFGENQGLEGPQPHEYSYRADTNVDVVRISFAEVLELYEIFPAHKNTILSRLHLKKAAANIDPFQPFQPKFPKTQINNEADDSIGSLPPKESVLRNLKNRQPRKIQSELGRTGNM